jgi:hypothetical protein
VHYRQVTVAMQEDGGRIIPAGKMRHVDFLNWVQKKLLEGWQINSCFEAGASDYWLHRELVKLGVKNLVVVAKAMNQGGKKQKTDKRGAGLCAIAPGSRVLAEKLPGSRPKSPYIWVSHRMIPSSKSQLYTPHPGRLQREIKLFY